LKTASRAKLNRETYHKACGLFDLNRATLQCAMLKALSAYRSYLSKKSSLPKFDRIVPVMVRQDCYSIHQLPSGTWVIKFPVSSGRSQIAVPIATSEYHAKRLQDLAGGSCRQGSVEIWLGKDGEWYAAISLVYETHINEPCGVIGVGNASRYNRKAQGWFKCTRCGYQSDADRVGAINIAARGLDALGA